MTEITNEFNVLKNFDVFVHSGYEESTMFASHMQLNQLHLLELMERHGGSLRP